MAGFFFAKKLKYGIALIIYEYHLLKSYISCNLFTHNMLRAKY